MAVDSAVPWKFDAVLCCATTTALAAVIQAVAAAMADAVGDEAATCEKAGGERGARNEPLSLSPNERMRGRSATLARRPESSLALTDGV